jgi:predicted nucleic acid-binding protein
MSEGAVYLDASALVKLVAPEEESDTLEGELSRWSERLSSAVVVTEVERAVRRRLEQDGAAPKAAAARLDRTRGVLGSVALMDVDLAVLRRAGSLDPPSLRTLDAIHLATVLEIAAELDAVISYDRHLAEAMEAAGVTVLTPGFST